MKYEFIEKPEGYFEDENKLHIGVVGSRTITYKEEVKNLIEIFTNSISIGFDIPLEVMVIVTGGAKGVDSFAEEYAIEHNHDVVVIKPNWKKYGKSASIKRNTEIVNVSDIIFAIVDKPTGGTWDTIKKAEKEGKSVFIQKLYEDDE